MTSLVEKQQNCKVLRKHSTEERGSLEGKRVLHVWVQEWLMVFVYFTPALVEFDGYSGSVFISKAVCSLEAQFTTSVYPNPYAFPKSPVNMAFSDSQFLRLRQVCSAFRNVKPP